jgi:glycosyltransferase involved in cell wall biosynthesis
MNILELCLSKGFGGLELYVFRAAQALDNNHNVLAVLNQDSQLAEHFGNNSEINTTYFKPSRSFLPFIQARKLAKLIDEHSIDVMHMHHSKDLALAAFAKYFSAKKPFIIYTRQMQITRSKNDFYHNFLYKQMDLMLTITKRLEKDASRLISRYSEKIKTLYYGVNAPMHFLSKDERDQQRADIGFKSDDFIIGLLGRLEENKGQHLLIEAIARAKKEGVLLKALIVGHEMHVGYRTSLQKLATSKNIDDSIIFMDFVPDPQRLMQLCDCIVLATYEETFGLVLPEAMRSGIPVIGSNKGGVPEIIDHEETGLLFNSQDANSLYQQIKRLYSDEAFKVQLARNGKASADKRFNTEKHFERLEQHFTNLVKSS